MKYSGGIRAIRAARVRSKSPVAFWWAVPVFVVLVLLAGCQSDVTGSGGTISLWITRDYGQEEILTEAVEVEPGQSVLSILEEHVPVETAYGGGFVSSIAQLESGGGKDWFFAANGITAQVGAQAYQPSDGDIIWWDYRPWGGDNPIIPAVVGAWPQPFVRGYAGERLPVYVLYGEDAAQAGQALGDKLKSAGAKEVRVKSYDEGLCRQRQGPTLVVAPWTELAPSVFWQGIEENWSRTGWPARLTERAIYPLGSDGAHLEEGISGSAGVVMATGTDLGDETPLWLVTGLDMTGLEGVVQVMIEEPQALERTLGVLVVDGDVVELPVR